MSNNEAANIRKFSATGVDLGNFVITAFPDGGGGLAFDSAGTLYEAVEANPAVDNIHKFSPLGVDLGNFATFPAVDGPMFLAFEPSPVSEPSSLTLLAMGLSVLVGSFWCAGRGRTEAPRFPGSPR